MVIAPDPAVCAAEPPETSADKLTTAPGGSEDTAAAGSTSPEPTQGGAPGVVSPAGEAPTAGDAAAPAAGPVAAPNGRRLRAAPPKAAAAGDEGPTCAECKEVGLGFVMVVKQLAAQQRRGGGSRCRSACKHDHVSPLTEPCAPHTNSMTHKVRPWQACCAVYYALHSFCLCVCVAGDLPSVRAPPGLRTRHHCFHPGTGSYAAVLCCCDTHCVQHAGAAAGQPEAQVGGTCCQVQ